MLLYIPYPVIRMCIPYLVIREVDHHHDHCDHHDHDHHHCDHHHRAILMYCFPLYFCHSGKSSSGYDEIAALPSVENTMRVGTSDVEVVVQSANIPGYGMV